MGQTIELNKLVGKRISYHDGFTGSLTAFTIKEVKSDPQGESVEVRGERPQDFLHFTSTRARILAIRGELTYCSKIDGCAYDETFKIQG